MEQIVKIFVRQSYFIEDDLAVDYNVEKEAQFNLSSKDWIALIPKGWSGVDEQVVFKTVGDDSDVNLAIKSIVMEKKSLQNVVECQKQYQFMYISQFLEILGKSDYFVFLHQFGSCNCVSSFKTDNKDNFGRGKLSPVLNRRPFRRQSPTPREFYKNQTLYQNNVPVTENSKLKPFPSNILACKKCNAPKNFSAIESAFITKIQDLTKKNELIEQNLLKVQKDLVSKLEVANKQFNLSKVASQEKNNIQQFIEEMIEGLITKGKITFWAYDEEFTVVREYFDKDKPVPTNDDTVVSLVNNTNSANEEYLKDIIGQQEETIQQLVNKLKDMCEFFLTVNMLTSNEQDSSVLTSSENETCNMGFMDSSGTTYFSLPYCTEPLNERNVGLPISFKNKNTTKQIDMDESISRRLNNTTFDSEFSNIVEPKVFPSLNTNVEDKILTFEDWKKDKNEQRFCNKLSAQGTDEKTNELDNIQDNTDDLAGGENTV